MSKPRLLRSGEPFLQIWLGNFFEPFFSDRNVMRQSLKPWAGQKVTLKFVCDAGATQEGDWGALAYPEIIDQKTTMQYEGR